MWVRSISKFVFNWNESLFDYTYPLLLIQAFVMLIFFYVWTCFVFSSNEVCPSYLYTSYNSIGSEHTCQQLFTCVVKLCEEVKNSTSNLQCQSFLTLRALDSNLSDTSWFSRKYYLNMLPIVIIQLSAFLTPLICEGRTLPKIGFLEISGSNLNPILNSLNGITFWVIFFVEESEACVANPFLGAFVLEFVTKKFYFLHWTPCFLYHKQHNFLKNRDSKTQPKNKIEIHRKNDRMIDIKSYVNKVYVSKPFMCKYVTFVYMYMLVVTVVIYSI